MPHKRILLVCFCFLLNLHALPAAMHFRANAGQWTSSICFGLETGPASLAFHADGVTWSLRGKGNPSISGLPAGFTTTNSVSYQTRFIGSRPHLQPRGEQPFATQIRYLRPVATTTTTTTSTPTSTTYSTTYSSSVSTPFDYSASASTACTTPNLQTLKTLETQDYAAVRYTQTWPGIDILYYQQGQTLKYDLLVNPGADPNQIRIAYEGLEQIEVLPDGRLRLHTEEGVFHEAPPFTYQEIDGHRIEVPARYRLNQQCELTFEFPEGYDKQRTLVIDPVAIEWSTYLGGNAAGGGSMTDLALDEAGNVYGCGTYESGFPVTPGAMDTSFNGNFPTLVDAVIYKMDPTGSNLIWATYLGGWRDDFAQSLALDPAGNVYIAGRTYSDDFPVTPGVFQPTHGDGTLGNYDTFVTKISPNGDSLLYSTYYGGLGDEYGTAIDVNDAGEAFVGGYTLSPFTPTTSGAYDESYNGAPGFTDIFVFRLSADASNLIYSTYIGGSESESVIEILVNDQNEASITGELNSPNYPTTPNAVFFNRTGISACAYATRLSADGSQLEASTYYCGNRGDYAEGLALNDEGDFYITGRTYSWILPLTEGSYDSTLNNDADVFIARISADATELQYATYYGSTGRDIGTGIEVNDQGEIFVTGNTASLDFPTSECAIDSTNTGAINYWGGDAFLLKFDSTGERLLYSTLLGGSSDELIPALELDNSQCTQSLVIGTTTNSTDFPTTPNAYQTQKPQAATNHAITRLKETIDATIAFEADSCPVAGEPFVMSPLVNGCGYWSDLSLWEWDFGDGQTAIDSAPAHIYNQGTYTIRLRRPGCPDIIDERTINLFGVNLGPDLSLCRGDEVILDATTPAAVSYLWYDGATTPTHRIDKSGKIYVDVWDSEGCLASDTVNVTLLGEEDIEVPNAFSPNGDGINDNFFVTGLEGNQWSIEVFDRWGASRYKDHAYQNNWDGQNLPEGVYYYVLRSGSGCGNFVGHVTLVR